MKPHALEEIEARFEGEPTKVNKKLLDFITRIHDFQKTESTEKRNILFSKLYKKHKYLIIKFSWRFLRRAFKQEERDNVIQEASIAFFRAIPKADLNRELPEVLAFFKKSIAYSLIKKSNHRTFQSLVYPIKRRWESYVYRKSMEWQESLKSFPTYNETLEFLEKEVFPTVSEMSPSRTLKDVEDFYFGISETRFVTAESLTYYSVNPNGFFGEVPDPEYLYFQEESRDLIYKLMGDVYQDERNQYLFKSYILGLNTLQGLGDQFGLTRERVRQIVEKGTFRLIDKLKKMSLKDGGLHNYCPL